MEVKTIVVTGSTRGIGHGLAKEFLKKGQQVIINGRNEEQVNHAVEELQKYGSEVIGISGDVTHEGAFNKLFDQAISEFGKIDIWINNAGIPQTQKYFYELEPSEIAHLIEFGEYNKPHAWDTCSHQVFQATGIWQGFQYGRFWQ